MSKINTEMWDSLSRTDPAHTKSFKRAGGFSGTAIKPIWIIKRLTEYFGPVGRGWGMGEPSFQVVPGMNNEVMVYCTVRCWHTQEANGFYGVGGDKVVTHIKENKQYNRPERWESDDEAFKKAFTDAVGNAFKFIGMGADVHMGQFDDSKYVLEMQEEFSPRAEKPQDILNPTESTPAKKPVKLEGPYTSKTALWNAYKQLDRDIRSCGDSDQLEALLAMDETKAIVAQCERDAPGLLTGEGQPEEFTSYHKLVALWRAEFDQQPAYRAGITDAG